MKSTLQNALQQAARDTEARLAALLTETDPDLLPLFDGMRYSILAGGKRIRPFLTLAFAELFGNGREAALSFAAAVEMVHTYSLIHDDLPAMDNDDFRRGRPTNHKVYGEAEAILAGDALLTMAFSVIANAACPSAAAVRAVCVLADCAGARGMVGGQMMDIRAEKEAPDRKTLDLLHDRKTGALIRAAAELGAIAAGVTDEKTLSDVRAYAAGIGLAFQITDDVLDAYGDSAVLGKTVGKDARAGKTTYLSFMARVDAEALAKQATEAGKAAIAHYEGSGMLLDLADALLIREN